MEPTWLTQLQAQLMEVLPPPDTPSREVTRILTQCLVRWGQESGARVQREVKPTWLNGPTVHQGRLDFVFQGQRGYLAVELDRSTKLRSLEKLQLCRQQGWQALWIKWGAPPKQSDRFGLALQAAQEGGVHILHVPMHRQGYRN